MNGADFSNLERIESPRDRVRWWFDTAIVLLGLVSAGWFIGDSLRVLLTAGGWVAAATIFGAVLVVALWFWWAAWSRRAKLFGVVLLVLAICAPLALHYA